MMIVDMLGQTIEPGVWVAYSVKSGSWQTMSVGRVLTVELKTIDYPTRQYWSVKVQPLFQSQYPQYETGDPRLPQLRNKERPVTLTAVERVVVVQPTKQALELLNGE